VVFRSGLFKAEKLEQALVKAWFGKALGFNAAESQVAFHCVPGKPPSLSAQALAARVKASGRYNYRIRRADDEACTIEFFERLPDGSWESQGMASFTITEAKRAKLTSKDVWSSYPSDMLFNRAMTRGVRRFCPDLTFGLPAYSHEEIGNLEQARSEMQQSKSEVKDAEFTEARYGGPFTAEELSENPEDTTKQADTEFVDRIRNYAASKGISLTRLVALAGGDLYNLSRAEAKTLIQKLGGIE
jgi:hypothetical protein